MNKKKVFYVLLFIGIGLLFFLPRFVNLDHRIGFDWDQEKLSYEVKNIIVNHKFTLLGPRANNDKGFFLGPQFTYLLIPFYIISHLHPFALIYFMIVYNLVFFLTVAYVLKKMFSLKIALIFLAAWAVNTLLIEADISPFWPIFIPLGVVGVWYCLYKMYYYTKQSFPWLLLGIVLGFFSNMHFQFIFLIFYVIVFIIIAQKKLKITIIKMALFMSGTIFMFLPLIFFDLRHHFLNTSLFIRFFTEKDPHVGYWAGAWIPVFSNVIYPFVFLKSDFITGQFFYILVAAILILLALKKKDFYRYFYISSVCLWLFFPILFSIYGKRPSEYYFVFLYPFIILAIIDFFLSRKFLLPLTVFLILYTILNIISFYPKLNTFGLNFYQKDAAVRRIKEVLSTKKCDIAFNVPIGREVGYKYLFEYYGIQTIGDWKTCVININIPPRQNDEKFDYLGVTFPKRLLK